jgi:signal transduction histidine kinase
MRLRSQIAPGSWVRLPARTARLRLTLLYGALFLASGAGLLAITYVLVRSTGSSFYFTGRDNQPGVLTRSPAREQARPSPAFHARPGTHGLSGSTLQAFAAQARHQHATDLHHLLIWSMIALAMMAIVSIALGYYVAGRVLGPLRTITTTARAISARNLGERLALDGPDDEFKALGDTLDDLLARLQTAFVAQQHFVANASHELRSPLALEQTLLQLALSDQNPSIAALRTTCEKLLATSKRQQGLIEALLTLATSERGLDHHEPIDLSVLADNTLLALRPDADQQGIGITTHVASAPASGHPALVERLIANLIDNAIRYNRPGGCVHVHTAIEDGRAQLLVWNTGPEISPTDIERILEPFQRLKTTRTNGHTGYGLGLSIVQAISTAHHAQLTAQPRPNGGLNVRVKFPADIPPNGRPGDAAPAKP